MNSKILIAYASRCGATAEVAQAIGQDLAARGCLVDVMPAEKVKGVTAYGAVVLGSAVRFGKWLPEAMDFTRSHQAELKSVPTAFFTVHILNVGTDEHSRAARAAYTAPVRAIVQPGVETFFAGKLDRAKLSLFHKLIFIMMKEADLRDWNAIHAWGKSLFSPNAQG